MRQPALAAMAVGGVLYCATFTASAQREPAMTPPGVAEPFARALTAYWIELVLPETAYDPVSVALPASYDITAVADPEFVVPQHPVQVLHRHWPEAAPFRSTHGDALNVAHIQVMYRVYLKLPAPMQSGVTYHVVAAPEVDIGGPFEVVFGSSPTPVLHVNQVGYAPDGARYAYLSWYAGDGHIDFPGVTHFELVEESSGQSMHTGVVEWVAAAADEPWGKADLHKLDFSEFNEDGAYRLLVDGVGYSFPFEIGHHVFPDIAYTALRGLTMQRDGDHGLNDTNVTQWARPPAHLDDAIEQSTGERVDLVGGHMDAGDRGRYPWNAAAMTAPLLAATILFPDEILSLGETLDLPESNNAIPDWLDETIYALDWLAKAVLNTSRDGALPFYLRPATGGYELYHPPEGAAGRIWFDESMGPNRSETLYAAGVLAMAYNTPLLQEYAPSRATNYLAAALRAFNAFETHHADDAFWADAGWYDPYTAGPNPWSDEMLIAAANLLEATGDSKYLDWIVSEWPVDPHATRRWGWDLEGPWLHAYLSVWRVTASQLPSAYRDAARNAIINWADTLWAYDQPYGSPLIHHGLNGPIGYHLSGSMWAFPLMLAYGVTGETMYRDQIEKIWHYLLGANPMSRTFISGLGRPEKRPRWPIHEIAQYQWTRHVNGHADGWSELPPGIPSADLQNGYFDYYLNDAWNTPRREAKYPPQNEYAPLYRYQDAWNTTDEFVIRNMSRQAASLVPLLGTNRPPRYALTATSESGVVARVPDLSDYETGKPVQLTAVPEWGYAFVRWEGDLEGQDNPVDIWMHSNRSVLAVFESVPSFPLYVDGWGGEVAVSPEADLYPSGVVVTVTATPYSGFDFFEWSGDESGHVNPLAVTVDGPKRVIARFAHAWSFGTTSINASCVEIVLRAGNGMIVTGCGEHLWSNEDRFVYVYQDGLTGGVTLLARVDQFSGSHANARAGIMIRKSTAPDSHYQALLVKPDGDYVSQYRNAAWTSIDGEGSAGFPVWLRIIWDGQRMFTAVSSDGETWIAVGGQWFNQGQMSDSYTAGLALVSGSPNLPATAVFGAVEWPIEPVLPPDTDGDGMPDWWEQKYFGDTTAASPGEDSVGNGMSNMQDYIAGTDPTNSISVFALDPVRQAGEGTWRLRWMSRPERLYRVETSSEPGGPFQPASPVLSATPPINEWVVEAPNDLPAYFRVRVWLTDMP